MRLTDINPETTIGVYDCVTGDYITLGYGFSGSDDARSAAEDEVGDTEYILVAELALISTTLDEENEMTN